MIVRCVIDDKTVEETSKSSIDFSLLNWTAFHDLTNGTDSIFQPTEPWIFRSVTANINEHLDLNVVRVKWCYRLQWITVDDMMFGDFTPSDGLL